MRSLRWLLAFSVVSAAAITLGVIAFSLADREHTEQIARLERAIESELEASLRQHRVTITPAAEATTVALMAETTDSSANDGAVVGRLDNGRVEYGRPGVDNAITVEDRERFERALFGGESYEFSRNDPLRALDAYSFYVDRIASSVLRDRLRFRAARVAGRAGKDALAAGLLQDLLASNSGAEENGLPIDLLAGVRLLESNADPALLTRVEARLRARSPELSTPQLAYFATVLHRDESTGNPYDSVLDDRRSLETAVAEFAGQLTVGRRMLLTDRGIVLGRRSDDGVRVAYAPVTLPPLESGELETRRLTSAPPPAKQPSRVVKPLRLTEDGETLAWLETRDPAFAAKVELADERRFVSKLLIALLLLVVGGACVALWIAIDRQRRLAELKVRLLANVSHELKTPITSIRIFSEMLAEDTLEESKVREFGRLLTAESRRLTQRIEDLLDYAQESHGPRPLPTEELDLVKLLRPLADSFAFRARDSHVEFRCDVPDNLLAGRRIVTNSNAVERVVLNLLDNALKYRSKDDPWIELNLKSTDHGVQIHVKDNGVGISPKDQQRIFEEFYRARFEEYGVQGTGLGLAIARSLAERVGARLVVDSRPGIGSTFVLDLPLEPRIGDPDSGEDQGRDEAVS